MKEMRFERIAFMIFTGLVTISAVFFSLTALQRHKNLENELINLAISTMTRDIDTQETLAAHWLQSITHKEQINKLIKQSQVLEAQISVLEASVDPEQKRRMRVLATRDTMLTHLHGGRSIKACGQLNPWSVYKMAGWFVDYSDRYGVELPLILAVARRESAFCQKANSSAGAIGTMQLMPSTAEHLAQKIGLSLNRYRTEDNIRMGVYYLGQLLIDWKGNVELAVKSYNMGPTAVKRVVAGELPDYYQETRDYWIAVKQYREDFKKEGL